MSDLRFRGIIVPESELHWSFDPSGGPGGQHANRSATRVTLTLDLAESPSLPDDVRHRLLERLRSRITEGVISVTVDDTRSQWRNRAIARERLVGLLEGALEPRRERRPTKPSRRARARRLEAKRRRADKKRLRMPPDSEE